MTNEATHFCVCFLYIYIWNKNLKLIACDIWPFKVSFNGNIIEVIKNYEFKQKMN